MASSKLFLSVALLLAVRPASAGSPPADTTITGAALTGAEFVSVPQFNGFEVGMSFKLDDGSSTETKKITLMEPNGLGVQVEFEGTLEHSYNAGTKFSYYAPSSPCETVAPTPPTTVTTTPPTTTLATTVTTTPPSTCASFTCPKGSDKIDDKTACANGECSKETCCKALPSPCTTVTSTPATTVTTTPPTTCASFTCPRGSDKMDDKTLCADGKCNRETCCKAVAPPCPTFTTTLATTVTTTPPTTCASFICPKGSDTIEDKTVCADGKCNKETCCNAVTPPCSTVTTTPAPSCASFTCPDGYSTNAKDTVCARGECNKQMCCKYTPTTVTTTPPPTEPPSPCGTVAPAARKYDALMQQGGASETAKKESSMLVASWAFPLLGVMAMFSFAAFVAVRVHRGQRPTRQVPSFELVQAEDFEYAQFMSEEEMVV